MIIIGLIILALYILCLTWIGYGFLELKEFELTSELPKTHFTVIIPFRNEEKHLPELLTSLKNMSYPIELFELIFVDDSSEDRSVKIIKSALEQYGNNIQYRICHNERYSASPKKDAIAQGIKIAKHEWIITTDADGSVPRQWLNSYDAYIQKNNPMMVAGPISYKTNNSLIDSFQQLEGFSLLSIAIGGFGLKQPLFCNGANLAYQKKAFYEVKGFDENNHIASGDDVFMLEKMRKFFPGKVHYIKSRSALVYTHPVENWKQIINQRVRWASKTSAQNNSQVKILGLIVFMMNLTVILTILACFINSPNLYNYLTLIIVKIMVDFAIIRLSARFLRITTNPFTYLINSLIYPFVTVFVVLSSFSGTYHWKGRKFDNKV